MTEQLSEQSADNPMVKFLGPSIFRAIVVPLTWFAAESTPLQSALTALATRRSAAKFANRAQHFQPVPERNAKVFEMLIGQVGENGHIGNWRPATKQRGRFTLNSGPDCSDTATAAMCQPICGHSLVEDCAVPKFEQLEIC